MANGIYYVDECSGTIDDVKIMNAINTAHSAGGGKVVLSNRTYTITQSIVLYSNIIFTGVGNSSCISCSTDVPIIRINRGNGDSSNIEIRDMALFYASMSTTNSFHVEADRPFYLKIYNVMFYSSGRDCAGVLTWNADADRTTPISASSGYAAFMTHIENCLFNHGSIWLNDSDSRIINNYIWANETSNNNLDYAIRLSNGSVNISGNDIVAGNDAGIYLAETCAGIRIENNYFDGSWDGQEENNEEKVAGCVYTGWGIKVLGAHRVLILGNEFARSWLGGITVDSASQVTISNNMFIDLNRNDGLGPNYDIRMVANGPLSTGHIIEGNQHVRSLENAQSYAVSIEGNVLASIVNNSLLDWRENGAEAYFKPPFVMTTNKYAIRKDNRVTSRLHPSANETLDFYPYQFDEGNVTVQNSYVPQNVQIVFSADFSAQGILPKIQDINVNFVGFSSTSAVVFSIYDITVSGFKIAYRPVCLKQLVNNEPVCYNSTTDGIFFWRVSLQ